MKLGYVAVSNRVMIDGAHVGYLYREAPEKEEDSGWWILAGDETQEYVDDPNNFAFYNASTILERVPELRSVLGADYPAEFEWDPATNSFIEIKGDKLH
jgi:hypothetical protein